MRASLPPFLLVAAVMVGMATTAIAPGPWASPARGETALRRMAFFTNATPALQSATWFDDVVLAPERTTADTLTALRKAGVAVIAALTAPADGQPEALARKLIAQGYAGAIIDACSPGGAAQADALFLAFRRVAPRARLFWRCPEQKSPPTLHNLAGVVVRDRFTLQRPDGLRVPRPPSEVLALTASLHAAYVDKGVAVIALESLPRGRRDEARVLAQSLAVGQIIPWIDVMGAGLGVGLVEPVPRVVLGLYNNADDDFLPFSLLHRMAALPLEYLGYAIEYRDIKQGLPEGELRDRYAGIVTWFTGELTYPLDYANWLERQIDLGLRVAILGSLGASPTPSLLQRLGVKAGRRPLLPPVSIVQHDAMIGFEAPAMALARGLPPYVTQAGTRHVEVRDSRGQIAHPVVTGDFGGFAFDPYLLESGHRFAYRWRVDPFAFFTRALDLPPMPAPDPSTESGRRLLMVQIDGDGFNGRSALPGKQFSGEVILRDFLQIYRLPTTVSFVEGEIGRAGINPKLTSALEPIAREIARLSHVELASHTYSHPLDWPHPLPARAGVRSARAASLPIRGYKYSPAREVRGSVTYINQRIAPPGKRVKAVLWSGNALPDADVIKEADGLAIRNLNGVNCDEPYDAPSLTQVPSYYRPVGDSLQVYAPAHNENVYIESSRLGDQLSGFRNVIQMFEFTEKPRRLKPIDIYYHFYSGASVSGVNALRDVYLWAVKQETLALPLSEYADRVADFPGVTAARRFDGAWQLRGLRALRTLRIDPALGWPDLARSVNVIGVRDTPQGRHVALGPEGNAVLALAKDPPPQPHLLSANAPVTAWSRQGQVVRFRLQGHLPVSITMAACLADAQLARDPNVTVELDRARRLTRLFFPAADSGNVELTCR